MTAPGLVGADLERLGALASGVRRHGGELERLVGAADGAVGELGRIWDGPDAGQFARLWSARHRPALAAAVRALGTAADTMERNRREQERASGSLDGPPAPAGDGGHGFGFGDIVGGMGDGVRWLGDRAADGARWVGDQAADGGRWVADHADDILLDGLFYRREGFASTRALALSGMNPFLYLVLADLQNRYVTPVEVQLLDRFVAEPLVDAFAGPPEPRTGDPGGRLDTRPNGTFQVGGATDRDRGRAAVVDAFEATGDSGRIRSDEFQIIDHGNGNYTVVLPGVTDLSDPHAGFDPVDQSVRDTDQVAAVSAGSTGIDGNRYAQMVREHLQRADVPPGANLMIVGHSFGADTALDLASDPGFNGRDYHVTHVVAAAYYSQPQLPHVQPGTEVLVLQNNKDVPVLAEQLGHVPTTPFPGTNGAIVDRFSGGWAGAGHAQSNYIEHLGSGDPGLDAYFQSVDAAGYTASGQSTAVDVSITP
ncbi:MAG: hypothetical protein R2761_14940 [Acidimicrobiales bacterium]